MINFLGLDKFIIKLILIKLIYIIYNKEKRYCFYDFSGLMGQVDRLEL